MMTPEEIAREIEHISWQAGVVVDYDPKIAALLAAWRDECDVGGISPALSKAFDERDRLREENEALRAIISESAPVAWVGRDDIESARAWEIKATALLRAKGETK